VVATRARSFYKSHDLGMKPEHPEQRRNVLKLVAASAATLWLPQNGWSQPTFTTYPFTLGVASGSPTHDSVVLWTRLLSTIVLGNGAVIVRWEVAHDEKFTRIVQSGQTQATSELAHSVHVEVAGLEPDRWYFYRFMAGDAVSAVGRTRTFPAPDAKVNKLRLAYASCQRWEHGYFSAYRHMRDENLDAVMFLGDYIYEYPGAVNAVRTPPGGWVTTLDDYRQRYALHKGDADLQAMHAACPWLVTWDDHEVQNDYAGLQAGYTNAAEPALADNFAARRAAAYQAFYEHMPVRASVLTQALQGLAAGAEMRIYNRVNYGQLATFHMLDARQYKDPQPCTKEGRLGSSTFDPATCVEWPAPARTMLGAGQEAWLAGEFNQARKDANHWNVLGQQSLFGQRDFAKGPERLMWNDGWDGYPAGRTRLTDSLRKNAVANAVLLGGDVHENWVGHVKADYANVKSASIGVEFCGTSVTSRSNNATRAKVDEWLGENPHFLFADNKAKGYGVCEFTPAKLTTTLRVVDDVTRKDAKIETLASFGVQAGRAVVERL
jgi:alkaline phosphatase D